MKWGFSRQYQELPKRAATSVDFDTIIREIDANGAFDDFETPIPSPYKGHNYPTHPGDRGYSCPPQKAVNIDLPHALIKAKHDAARTGLELYMPAAIQPRWMHAYFATDFTNTASFRELLGYVNFLPDNSTNLLDDRLTRDYANAERKGRTDRRIFTADEIRITQDVCRKVPEIAISVLAYQSAFIEYFAQLSEAIQHSTTLTPEKKERGITAAKYLQTSWESNNFAENLYPAIALHYAQRTGGKSALAASEQDFTQGMTFANKSGIFNRTVSNEAGHEAHFTCPAKGMINRTSGMEFTEKPNNAPAEAPSHDVGHMGTGLFHIYRIVDEKVRAGGFAIDEIIRTTTEKVDGLGIPSHLARR